jgi:hypothetical protein
MKGGKPPLMKQYLQLFLFQFLTLKPIKTTMATNEAGTALVTLGRKLQLNS